MRSFKVFSEPKKAYYEMLQDISNAKKSVYLETYIFDADKIGENFREALIKKAREGVKVKLLIDAWGSTAKKEFFSELINAGGEVKLFKEIKRIVRILRRDHEVNHRKLLIIDRKITYIGSINITATCLNWRELVLKIDGPISEDFTNFFMKSWNISGKLTKLTKNRLNSIVHKGFEIIQDFPRDIRKITENKYAKLIKNARKEILIETPYFAPPVRLRRALENAVKRGVEVKLMIPIDSGVRLMDILHNRYLGKLHRDGVKIHLYLPRVDHSKLLLVDERFFLLGSSNVDYRSFVHDHEINLFGRDKNIVSNLKDFYNDGLKECRPFDYKRWKSRYSIRKLAEMMISLIERYL